MNTHKLYIASLRCVIKRISPCIEELIITHRHVDYILVKGNNSLNAFQNVKTGQKYGCDFCDRYLAIDLEETIPFNEATGNTQRYMSKRKALTLFDKKVDEWRSKK